MKSKIKFIILGLVCAALPIAAQTTAPENAERKRDSAQPQQKQVYQIWLAGGPDA